MTTPRARKLLIASSILLGLESMSCSSHQDDVCENVGACSRGGDSDWIASCKDEAKSLQGEANASGCGAAFDDYYSCAESNFTCKAITSTFPGCDAQRGALDECLSLATAKTSCAELSMKTSGCAPSDGGGVQTGSSVPSACTALRDCMARCYLENVNNPCAPAVDELERVSSCSSSCPP
jgi:hypothetical protein